MNTSLLSRLALGRRLKHLWCVALLLASVGTSRAQAPAQVTTIYGLGTATQTVPVGNLFFPAGASIGDQGLVYFFTAPNGTGGANPAALPVKISNVASGQMLVGIDARPLTGQMYALGYDPSLTSNNAQLYTLNTTTGVVTPVGGPISLALGTATDNISFDFDPTSDQIRVLSTNDNNYRLNPTTGALLATDTPLAYVGGTPANPGVVTAAYTNSTIGSTSTTLYDIDKLNGSILAIQNPPAAGTLTDTQHNLLFGGIDNLATSLYLSLDIANNATMGYLLQTTAANGSGLSGANLFDLDLTTGVVTNKRNLVPASSSSGFNIFDIAVPIAAPVCDAPTNPSSSAVTSTGATITFTPSASATNYTVTVTPAGGSPTTQTATGSPVTLTGLTPATNYTVSIVSNCFSGLITSSAVSTSFTTLTPTCTAPSNLTATNVTNSSAIVTFTGSGSATSYTVTTSPATTTQTLPAGATSVDFTGLTPSTTYTVSIVSNCSGGATATATVAFTTSAPNPAPTITNLSPSSATAGSAAFTLTVTGTGFISGSVVNFNGTALTTTYVSATSLTAAVPASFIATAGTYNVTVTNPAPGGGTSAAATFTVNNPAPTITSLSPSAVTAGAAAQTLTVNGTGFVNGSTVSFNGTTRTTSFVSATQLTISLTAADQATPGNYNVTVTTPTPGGGTSAPATFTVNAAPCNAPSGLAASNVTATSATVNFTGSGTATGYTVTTSPTTTTQTLAANATSVSFAGLTPGTTYTVSIVSNCSAGATSSPATVAFTTTAPNPAPTITSLSPSSATAGGAAFTLTVTGTGFIAGSVVTFNGTARPTTFVSATSLTASIPASDIATAGSYGVTVTNPAPGGGTSAAATFTVNAAPCNAPSGLTAGSVTSNSATVSFTGSGTATGYTVTTSPATTTQTLAANATSVSFTGLTPSTTYTVSIVSNCSAGAISSAATVSFTTTAAPLTDLIVSTQQNVSGSYNNVTVTSTGVANLTGTLNVAGTLTVQTGGGLVQNCQSVTGTGNFVLQAGANLVICDPAGISTTGATGAIQVSGSRSFSPDASYAYNNPSVAQVTGPGLPSRVLNMVVAAPAGVTLSQALSVTQVLRLQPGNLTTNGMALTLLSSAAGTALVDNTGGVVNGTATVQRYIDPSLNPGPGYRHYSAPVSNTTVADLATTGFTPIVNPAYNTVGNTVTPFPNVYGYNEARVTTSGNAGSIDFDKGWFSPNSLSDPLVPTQGYTVNITASALVDFVGSLNSGTLNTGALPRGTQAQSGWHLRGNPYPSPLNWNALVSDGRLSGIDNALYVFKSSGQYTGSYASYVAGVSTNGGTNVLPVAQGFFVRTSTPGASGSITFTNQERLTSFDATPFQRGAADSRTQLLLSLSNATAATQAAIYFDQGATTGIDRAFDAFSLPAPNGLTLATEAGSEALAINGLPVLTGSDVLVPLRVASLAAGNYTLAADNLAHLPAAYHAYLRDALTGTYTDLASTPTLSLTLAANGAAGGRYAVLFTTQARVLATAPAALARLASVYPNPAHGSATLLLPVALRGTQATAVSVVDNLGRVVLTRTLAVGAAETLELPLAGLATGVYSVQARTASGLVVKRLVVE